MKTILHIDFNSYFASVEQQANPRLRGKPIGVTGGDRETRTVLSTASIEAKKLGVKTGMPLWEAKKVCPNLIIICSDHEKYLSITKRFLNIIKDYTPYLEVFSIDECFLELPLLAGGAQERSQASTAANEMSEDAPEIPKRQDPLPIAREIKARLKAELGEKITCSIGISYNKLMAKLAGSLKKPDGLVVIPNEETAVKVLDQVELDDVCGIGPRIKKRLFQMGVRNFKDLRQVPKDCLLASFKSYGEILYNMARGIDHTPVTPFYEKQEIKSVGHRHTLEKDISDSEVIRQTLLKLCELIAQRLRSKNLSGKTIHCWYRSSSKDGVFYGEGMQQTLARLTFDGLEIFQSAWEIFQNIWQGERIRMVGVAVSNLKPSKPVNLSWLPEEQTREIILKTLDKVNNKYGDFTLQRGILLQSMKVKRKPNPFLSDRRFRI